jgi:hypothetical protein
VDDRRRPARWELIGCDFSVYPNIKRWLENMKKLKSWNQVNEVFNGFIATNKGKEFVRVWAPQSEGSAQETVGDVGSSRLIKTPHFISERPP